MDRYMKSVYDVILDRSPEGLIGAILIALVLSLVVAGVFALLRTRVSDASVLLTCLVLTANVLAMTLAAGYVQFASSRGRGLDSRAASREDRFLPGAVWRGPGLASRILAAADSNGDRLLSHDEAVAFTERFYRETGNGHPVDEETLRNAIREWLSFPGNLPRGSAEEAAPRPPTTAGNRRTSPEEAFAR